MRVPRIYTNQPLSSGVTIDLEPAPSHHISKVLRMQPGRELVLFNGEGGEFVALVEQVGKKQVRVKTGAFADPAVESPLKTELLIGISRGDRMDWVLQKATELGVSQIQPVFTERTEVKLSGDRLSKRVQHWRQTIIGACEQCQRTQLPKLLEPLSVREALAEPRAQIQYVLHHRADTQLKAAPKPESVCLLIGPEGGLSDDEIAQAEAADFRSLTLGPRVLRTETAPIAALAVLQFHWGDF